MDKVSRVLYVIAGLANATAEVFCVLVILCSLDQQTGWGLSPTLQPVLYGGAFSVEDASRVVAFAYIALPYSIVLYFCSVIGRRNLKLHKHKLACHIITMIVSVYYFVMAINFLKQAGQGLVGYIFLAGAILYFSAGLTGAIGHNN